MLQVLKREPETAGQCSRQDYQGLLPRVDIFSFRQSYYQTTSPTPRVLSSHTAVPEANAWAVFEQAERSFKATESNPFSLSFSNSAPVFHEMKIFLHDSHGVFVVGDVEKAFCCSFLHVKGLTE